MTAPTLPVDGYGLDIGGMIDMRALDQVMRRPLSELGASPLRTIEDAIAAIIVGLASHYGRLPTLEDYHLGVEFGRDHSRIVAITTDGRRYHADFDTDTVAMLRDLFGVLPH